MSRWQPPHPARIIRPPSSCPTGEQRYATEQYARRAIPIYDTTGQTAVQCSRCDGGWHLIRPTEGDTR